MYHYRVLIKTEDFLVKFLVWATCEREAGIKALDQVHSGSIQSVEFLSIGGAE